MDAPPSHEQKKLAPTLRHSRRTNRLTSRLRKLHPEVGAELFDVAQAQLQSLARHEAADDRLGDARAPRNLPMRFAGIDDGGQQGVFERRGNGWRGLACGSLFLFGHAVGLWWVDGSGPRMNVAHGRAAAQS